MTENASDLPETAKPTVFRHEGRRLFIFNGEARIVDIDAGSALGMTRDRNVRSLIARQQRSLTLFGPLLSIDPRSLNLLRYEAGGDQPAGSEAVDQDFLSLLKAEGVLDTTKRGTKPTLWFLNLEQMQWVVAKSDTEMSDDLLRDLFRIYKAWKAGTLEPARPALEPPKDELALPKAAVAPKPTVVPFPSPSAREPDVEFGHRNGVLFALVEDTHHVLEDSLAEIMEMSRLDLSDEIAKWPQLALLGEMPSFGTGTGRFLNKAHVTFMIERIPAARASLGPVAAVFEAFEQRKAYICYGEVRLRGRDFYVGSERMAREIAEAVDSARHLPAPSDFLRDGRGYLRMRHDRVAQMLGRDADEVAEDVRRLRGSIEDDKAGLIERLEVRDGVLTVGIYMMMPHVARFCEFTGDSAAVILETFGAWQQADESLMKALDSDRDAFVERAAALRVDPGEFAGSVASAGAVGAVEALRADLASAGVLPASGEASPRLRGFGLRRLLSRLWGGR